MKAIIISIGDELVLGQTVDTNAAWLSAQLAERGILTRNRLVLPDDKDLIAVSLKDAGAAADLVIISGGLGPTADDLTRDAVAEVMGVGFGLHEPSLANVARRFAARGAVMPASCRVQAMIPVGAEALENTCGTAPGLKARIGLAMVYVVPGVPSEMKAMFINHIAPDLTSRCCSEQSACGFICVKIINTFGCGESDVAGRLGELMDRKRNPSVGTTVSGGVVSVRLRGDFSTRDEAMNELEKTARAVRARLGCVIFGEESETLQDAVGRLLTARGRTVATAESCTAGLLGKMITDPPGASGWYAGGWIVYSNRLKNEQLGVPLEMLESEGAVSEGVAGRMAVEALVRAGADYSLALTGIAGPGGAVPGKPVGTVWIALGTRGADGAACAKANRFIFPGERDSVRDRAAKTALNMLRLELPRNIGASCKTPRAAR